MPTNAFVNLTKLKKQKLVSDGFLAFSKLKYKQTNVNEITRELGITRTAFYYYFNDKKDFYDYLLYEKREEFMQTYVYNQQDKIDFFDLLLILFDYLSNYKGMPHEGFFKDLFINIDYFEQNNLLEQIVSKDNINTFSYIKGLEKFSMDTKEEIFEFVILLFSFVFNSTLNYYLSNESQEHAKHVLEKKLKYLQNGIIKKEYRGDNI